VSSYFFLGERLTPIQWAGVVVTLITVGSVTWLTGSAHVPAVKAAAE